MSSVCQIAVLGGGAFGTALAHMSSRNANNVVQIYARNKEIVDSINKFSTHPQFNPEVKFQENVSATSNIEEALKDTQMVISCIPTQNVINTIKDHKDLFNQEVPFVSCSKGMLINSEEFISQAYQKIFTSSNNYCVLSGPSFSNEIIMGHPTLIVCASENEKFSKFVKQRLSNKTVRVYSQKDVIGVEIAGALKNIIAIGAGMVEGYGFGINSVTAMIVRGTQEIQTFARVFGANPHTFFGLAGIGDLMLTGFGKESRNRTFGVQLGQGQQIQDILAESKGVVEGLSTLDVVWKYAQQQKLDMPITQAIYGVCHGHLTHKQAWEKLMLRELEEEFPTIEN